MARNEDWTLINDEEHEVLEEEEEEEQDEGRRVCGDRVLTDEDRRRWYDDELEPEELTGFLSW